MLPCWAGLLCHIWLPAAPRCLLPLLTHATYQPALFNPFPFCQQAGEYTPEVYVERSKRVLARMTLGALRHLHARGRLMEGVLWQVRAWRTCLACCPVCA